MDLSIVIVSYNTKELLNDCLTSINNATKPKSTEVFVVDNASSDRTVEHIKKQFPQVKLIANKKNLGFSKANNLAIKKAKGKYILVLNPDTKIMPNTLDLMLKFMQNHKDVAIASCRVELPNGELDKDCRRHFPTPWRAFTHFSNLSKIFAKSKIFDGYQMGYISNSVQHEIDSCVGAFMFVRSSLIKKVGLLDEDFFFYGEDLDWCYRFKEAGYKIVYTPITKIIHYKGAASGMKPISSHLTKATRESKKRAFKESVRAMELFYKKHYINKYPFFVNWLILTSLKILGKIRTLSV